MALVEKAKVSGQPGEVALPAREAFKRGTDAQPHPMARHRVAGGGGEGTAEVMGGNAENGRQLRERAVRVDGQRLSSGVGEASACENGGGPAGGDPLRVGLLERRGGQQDRSFDQLMQVAQSAARC